MNLDLLFVLYMHMYLWIFKLCGTYTMYIYIINSVNVHTLHLEVINFTNLYMLRKDR